MWSDFLSEIYNQLRSNEHPICKCGHNDQISGSTPSGVRMISILRVIFSIPSKTMYRLFHSTHINMDLLSIFSWFAEKYKTNSIIAEHRVRTRLFRSGWHVRVTSHGKYKINLPEGIYGDDWFLLSTSARRDFKFFNTQHVTKKYTNHNRFRDRQRHTIRWNLTIDKHNIQETEHDCVLILASTRIWK